MSLAALSARAVRERLEVLDTRVAAFAGRADAGEVEKLVRDALSAMRRPTAVSHAGRARLVEQVDALAAGLNRHAAALDRQACMLADIAGEVGRLRDAALPIGDASLLSAADEVAASVALSSSSALAVKAAATLLVDGAIAEWREATLRLDEDEHAGQVRSAALAIASADRDRRVEAARSLARWVRDVRGGNPAGAVAEADRRLADSLDKLLSEGRPTSAAPISRMRGLLFRPR